MRSACPVLMRPSYVLGGQNMIVAYTKADVIEYMGVITEHVDMDHPVLLDKYILGTECEVDAICDGENFLIPGIMEQVERTGVHSGDSICVYPAQHLTQAEIDTMVDYTGRFARELHVTGLVNVQYAVSNGKVYVIEVNPRSSRTVPYISKVTGVPMVDLAVRCCLGEKLTDMGYGTGLHPNAPYVAVKVPVFSFEKLHGVDTQFGPEMKSTGEVLGIAPNYHDALLKGLIGAGYTFKTPGPASCCIFTVKDSDKPEFVDIAWKLKSMGYKLYGTSGTCAWLNKHMVPCNEVRNMSGEAAQHRGPAAERPGGLCVLHQRQGPRPQARFCPPAPQGRGAEHPLRHCRGYRQRSGRLPAQRPQHEEHPAGGYCNAVS